MRLRIGKKFWAAACAATIVIAAVVAHTLMLRPYTVTAAQLQAAYAYPTSATPPLRLQQVDASSWSFVLRSFDGAPINGRIAFPRPPGTEPVPVMIGIHGMGRSEARWWQDSIDGRPTIEQVDKLTQLALAHGYAVVTIDARYHGLRKDPRRPLPAIMRDLRFFGDRTDYERMVVDTVRDHRVLLDWLTEQAPFVPGRISAAGYSMGAQIALLLGAIDDRVDRLLAIVPPHIGDETAIVAPQNAIDGLRGKTVWLVSASDDEYASSAQNEALFRALPTSDKRHKIFAGGHILPTGYVAELDVFWREGQGSRSMSQYVPAGRSGR